MDRRVFYQPFWRINKSVLPLGITWEEVLPSLYGFLFLQIFLDDIVVPLIIAIFLLITTATLKRTHRTKAARDLLIKWTMGDHLYVEKSRSFEFPAKRR